MKVTVYTLVDITNTGVVHATGIEKDYQQHSNYNTVIQTVSLTTNVEPTTVTIKHNNINGIGFGSKYRNTQKYWMAEFNIEQENSITLPILLQNFNYVPVITGLDETVKIDKPLFLPNDPKLCNVFFNLADN